MSRYLKKIVSIVLLYAVLILGANRFIIHLVHKKYFQSQDFETLVIGDSGFYLLNEYELKGSRNFSKAGSIYKIMYHKAKSIFGYKPYNAVVMPFSFSNISAFNDDVLSEHHNADEYIRRLYPFSQILTLYQDQPNYKTVTSVVLKYLLSFNMSYAEKLVKSDETERLFIDVNIAPHRSRKQSRNNHNVIPLNRKVKNANYLERRIPQLYISKDGNYVSQSSIEYLHDIVAFCQENSVRLILVRMPLTKAYQMNVPKECASVYNSLKNKLELQGVEFLDFLNDYNNQENTATFANDDHLSPFAAAEVSKRINTILLNE